MKTFESWVLEYLLNSIWQVPVVFAAAWVASRLVRRAGARMEHWVWASALLLEVVLPACSFHLMDLLREIWRLVRAGSVTTGGEVRVAVGAGVASGGGVLRLPSGVLAGIAVVYGCLVLYFAGRLAWGLWRTDVMRRQAERVTLTGGAAQMWERYCKVFAVDAPEVAVSPMISGPVTVGVRRGVLLMPRQFLESVAEGDLDAVVAHEFAHMRRRDFLKNLLYGVLSLPVAYHPLLWMTRSQMAESRGMVCDAMAAEAVAGRERYARSLLRLASMLAHGTPVRTLHAIGIFDANLFERRVMNLTKKRVEIQGVRRLAMTAACVVVGLATCASALALRMEVSAPVAQSGGQVASTAKAPVQVAGGVMAGSVLSRVTPVYPQEAKDAKLAGAVVLHAVIGRDGTIQQLRVASGPDKLRQSALDAVHQWTYKPYLLNGEPVEVETTITVTYSLTK